MLCLAHKIQDRPLWDGTKCSDVCHLMHDPDNGPFIPETASIWTLR